MEPNLIAYESDYVKGYHWWIHGTHLHLLLWYTMFDIPLDVPHNCTPTDLFKEKPPGKYPYGSGVNKNGNSRSLSPETTPEPQPKPTSRMTDVPRIIAPAPRSSTRKSLAPKAWSTSLHHKYNHNHADGFFRSSLLVHISFSYTVIGRILLWK